MALRVCSGFKRWEGGGRIMRSFVIRTPHQTLLFLWRCSQNRAYGATFWGFETTYN